MINVRFYGKRYKIYANGKIKCLDEYSEIEMNRLKEVIQEIEDLYRGPEHGFLVSNMAHILPEYEAEIISYRDYEMENAKPDTIY